MIFLRNKIMLVSALTVVGMLLVPLSAQAACDGGSCPIVGGSLRTLIGGGFIIPQVPTVSPGTGPAGQLDFANTAHGAIRPKPNAQINVPSGQPTGPLTPRSFSIPIGQLSYGSAGTTTTMSKTGYYTTPVLVQVPLNGFVAALMGVSTNIGQSFPGDARTFPTNLTSLDPLATVIGGPAQLSAGGRPGAATLTNCAGAIVPATIPGTWSGGCTNFTPFTVGGLTGVQVAPALMRYTRTSNQFGGAASQRQVRRTAVSTSNNWLGRINFNNFIAPYTAADMAMTSIKKVYPTLPQNLIEPAVWGAPFGAVLQRFGSQAVPGNLVSAFLTTNGKPLNTSTVMVTTNPVSLGGPGTGMGLVQTSTSWGGPLTTGMVTVQLVPLDTNVLPSTWSNTGSDHRDTGGNGYVSLVSGSVSSRNLSGAGTSRTMLTLLVPEPGMAVGLFACVVALAGLSRRRI
jgi:hypothetical protein